MHTEPTAMSIRQAVPDEAGAILALTQAAFAVHEGLDPPSSVFDETEADVRQAMAEGEILVAERDGELVGAARVQPLAEQDALYCGRLAVAPSHQGIGIGSALTDAVERLAAQQGYPAVVLGARVQLGQNIRFFTKRGYVLTGEHSHPGYSRTTYLRFRKNL
ncbi:MAG TPA: GNAT family N-acetyltransferase [Chloroflexota bacterium]|nr:GNAT family N-acetyltransferase [Chloroflexota bacterium]